ncbi:peroxisomal catalase 1-like [Maniola jurtina]|uniref:peroxisomal catalase 1-like n=1 Tax=Maniola jurtina TaxID=191418 RepID=UPI001E68A9AE|nr:peroxisomal catalase 1-like [Maniola jurtina]
MKGHTVLLCHLLLGVQYVMCSDHELYEYLNMTEPANRQLYEFKLHHKKPIGILTTGAGQLVEIRETVTLNSDAFSNQYFINLLTHNNAERIPERNVHAKGGGAYGYFEVTHDVSEYIKSDVFNGIGKKTPIVSRFSPVTPNLGGSDLVREHRGMAVKFFTKEGNLDLVCISFPVFFHKDPIDFPSFVHSRKRNPKTNLMDFSMHWDFVTKRPVTMHAQLWLLSDFGIPNGYRKMNAFAVHTFEVYNKFGKRYFVRFNFRTNQGIENLSTEQAEEIQARDPDYFNRDLYNAIEKKHFPSWTLEMDVLLLEDVTKLDYDPFDITRLWKKGTYKTVPIGCLTLVQNPDNFFKDVELSAYDPGHLVPGIIGGVDDLFRARRFAYRDTQVYRLGVNHNRIEVNNPLYRKVYNRDGVPPVRENMKDAPNYYPNSFNGPVPYVDPNRPKDKFVIYSSNAVDLQPAADFYNKILQCEDQRERLVNNTVTLLLPVSPKLQRRVIRLFSLTDENLGKKVETGLKKALHMHPHPPIIHTLKFIVHDKHAI